MATKHELSAGGIVFKQKEDKPLWLIVKHSKHEGWIFPKGLIGDDKDESMEEAALRETEEEGGVKARIIGKVKNPVQYFYKFKGDLIEKKVYYFLMKYLSGNPEDHDWEVSEAKFVTTEEVKKTLTYDSDRQAFEQALKIYQTKV